MIDSLFFVASKVLWTVVRPDSWLVFGVAAVAWGHWRGRPRLFKGALISLGLYVAVLTLFPVGAWLLRPLESAFPPGQPPERVDGIIVLGGFEDFAATAFSGQPSVNQKGERILEALALAQRYPEATVVFSGGSGDPRRSGDAGADIAFDLAQALGADVSNIVLERESRNTYENAVNTLELVEIGDDEVWLLITSAYHMPRSVGVFCAQGAELVPYPVDYLSGDAGRVPTWRLAENMELLGMASHTWVGQLVYWATGRSSAFFPRSCS